MTPHYADDWLTVYHGDSRAVMAQMEPESVHCVVTSPPYWGLRDYGTATWVGGDETCDHVAGRGGHLKDSVHSTRGGANKVEDAQAIPYRHACGKCGATRVDDQLGLEPTPEAYVANMVEVFREVRRVLRSDGTVWLNLGDSYAADRSYQVRDNKHTDVGNNMPARVPVGLKPKDLVGIPWMVAFALRADGWYLRSDVIWSKPNPMPESVTDRPTKSHEYLFLLSKSPRYYFDADAVREGFQEQRTTVSWSDRKELGATAGSLVNGHSASNPRGTSHNLGYDNAGRNIRSVWTVATAPYPGAHFATFPPKLIEPCIKAGTSEGGVCPECGAPWVRLTESTGGETYSVGKSEAKRAMGLATQFSGYAPGASPKVVTTLGWRPSCSSTCDYAEADHQSPVPATVLDPFAGSGTTGLVAQRLSRRAVLIDLSMDYLGQLLERNRDIPLGLGA